MLPRRLLTEPALAAISELDSFEEQISNRAELTSAALDSITLFATIKQAGRRGRNSRFDQIANHRQIHRLSFLIYLLPYLSYIFL